MNQGLYDCINSALQCHGGIKCRSNLWLFCAHSSIPIQTRKFSHWKHVRGSVPEAVSVPSLVWQENQLNPTLPSVIPSCDSIKARPHTHTHPEQDSIVAADGRHSTDTLLSSILLKSSPYFTNLTIIKSPQCDFPDLFLTSPSVFTWMLKKNSIQVQKGLFSLCWFDAFCFWEVLFWLSDEREV